MLTFSLSLSQLLDQPDDEQHQLVLRALGEAVVAAFEDAHALVTSKDAVATLREARQAELKGWAEVRAFWTIDDDNNAVRRDGVSISRGWPIFFKRLEEQKLEDEVFGLHWAVRFPPLLGGPCPALLVEAENIADAIQEVEARWPLAAWWSTVDVEDRRLGMRLGRYTPKEDER